MYERRPVVGYEGLYEVSSDGEVFRLSGSERCLVERKLKPTLDTHGYLIVSLWRNGVGEKHTVHRIVLQAFKPNPANLPIINHINGIKIDNRADNIEWCDKRHDVLHSYRILGRKPPMQGKRNPNAGSPKKPVSGLNIKTMEVVEMESLAAAARFVNGHYQAIRQACQGKIKHAYGWRWAYI